LTIVGLIVYSFIPTSGNSKGYRYRYELGVNLFLGVPGVSGVLKAGIVPVMVEIHNREDNFSGEIQVFVENDNKYFAIHSMEVDIPGDSDEKYMLDVPIQSSDEKLYVSLVKDGKMLDWAEWSLDEIVAPETTLIGIVSDKYRYQDTRYEYLRGIKLPVIKIKESNAHRGLETDNIEAKIVNLAADYIYKEPLSYSSFDVLIIDDFDSGLIKDEQYEAIEKWLSSGGILIINKGDSPWDLIRSKEDIIISDNIDTLCEFVDEENPIENLIVNNGSIDSGNVLLDFNGKVLAASKKYGKGIIYQTTFDMTAEPFFSWKGNLKFIKKLIESNMEILNEKANTVNYGYMTVQDNTPIEVMSELQKLNIRKIILIISVLIAGVILAILLKLINKRKKNWIVVREINWIVIPIVSIVIAIGIYKFDSETPIVNNVSVIELLEGLMGPKVEAGLTIYSNAKKIELESRNYVFWEYIGNENNSISNEEKESAKKELEYIINYDGNRTKIEMFNAGIGKPKKLGLTGYARVGLGIENIYQNNFKLYGKLYDEYLDIKVINGTGITLNDPIIIYGKNVYQLDTISYLQNYENELPIESSISIDEYLSKMYENKNLVIEKEQLRKIIESKINSNEESLNDANSGKIVLISVNDDERFTFRHYTVNGKEPKINTSVVYIKEAKLYDSNQTVKIPEGKIEPRITSKDDVQVKDGLIYLNESVTNPVFVDFIISEDVYVENFRINWPKEFNNTDLNTNEDNNETSKDSLLLYIYNRELKVWELLSDGSYINTDRQYCDINGYVRLKVEFTYAGEDVKLSCPQISLEGITTVK